jgi:hypothetical protein
MPGSGITFVAMHPGWADTPGLAESLPGFARLMRRILRDREEGVDTLIWLATAPSASVRSGRFYHDRRERPFDRVPATRVSATDRSRLWSTVVRLARVTDPAPDIGAED